MGSHSKGSDRHEPIHVKAKDVEGFEKALHGEGSYDGKHRTPEGGQSTSQQREAARNVPRQRTGE